MFHATDVTFPPDGQRIANAFATSKGFHFTGEYTNSKKILIAKKYKMTISRTKTKSMAMWGNHIQRVKIVINDNIIEQVTDFKYLGYCISEFKSDLEDKLQT